jgi:putative transposase
MRFTFIAKHRGIWPVSWLCEALGVSRSGFHAWLVRAPSARARSDIEVGRKVRASFTLSDRTYGARRVWHDVLADGVDCGLHRIERLMRQQGLRARPRRRGLPKDHGEKSVVAANVLDRQFVADAPNQKWVADFTYIWTAQGWLYVAAVIDLFSRRVVGWSMSATMTAQLVADAMMMAIWRRGKPDALLHHSDQGSQYTSEQFQRLIHMPMVLEKRDGLICIGRVQHVKACVLEYTYTMQTDKRLILHDKDGKFWGRWPWQDPLRRKALRH